MAIQIQFRRGTAAEWTSVNPILAEGEMGIETDTSLFKIGNGNQAWNLLDYGGLRGYSGSSGYTGSIGNISVQNVLYVSKSGNDSNDGASLNTSKLTIKAALQIAAPGTTIFVKSGDYTEINPLTVPAHVSVVGDNLRTVTVRPQTKTTDLFYVNNGCYLSNMTFKDHESPAAAVAFNPDGSAGVIFMSPYVQNCTSMTTTGCGMRVNGNYAQGTKSMVVDAYTQYNQGGIGIHMLNQGYTQLVSVFTICCDKAILCESGGNCSVTNSNSSFGNYALYSDGVSAALYTATVEVTVSSGNIITVNGLTNRPNLGDALRIFGASTGSYFTVQSATDLTPANVTVVSPYFTNQGAEFKNTRTTILDAKSKIQVDTIDYINETYPNFEYNQIKCSRDLGYIINAVVDDMAFGANYKSVQAGIAYYRGTSANVINNQKTETIAAINFAKTAALASIVANHNTSTTEYIRVKDNFEIVTTILSSGTNVAPSYIWNGPVGVDPYREYAKNILVANRSLLIEETIAYLDTEYPELSYDKSKCRRDMGYIIDAVTYDMLYSGNSETANAADEYYSSGYLQIAEEEKQPTIDAYTHIKSLVSLCLVNQPINRLQNIYTQVINLAAATSNEVTIANGLFDIVTELVANAYTSTVTLEENIDSVITQNTTATFHQFSLITSSGHTFEWVGAGTNINSSLPSTGGIPLQENQTTEINGGRVYFTSTDEKGDFRIGNDFVINRKTGTITGRTFNKSLFAVMTPYILAIGK
jgi:hypothetical protein